MIETDRLIAPAAENPHPLKVLWIEGGGLA